MEQIKKKDCEFKMIKKILASALLFLATSLFLSPLSLRASDTSLSYLNQVLIEQNTFMEKILQELAQKTSGLEKRHIEDGLAELDKARERLESGGSFPGDDEEKIVDFLDQFAEVREELDDLLDDSRKDSDRYLERLLKRGIKDDQDRLHTRRRTLSGEISGFRNDYPLAYEAGISYALQEYSRIRELAQIMVRYQILEDAEFRLKLLLNTADRYLSHIAAAVLNYNSILPEARSSVYQKLLEESFRNVPSSGRKISKSLAVRLENLPGEHSRFFLKLSEATGQGRGVISETLDFLSQLDGEEERHPYHH